MRDLGFKVYATQGQGSVCIGSALSRKQAQHLVDKTVGGASVGVKHNGKWCTDEFVSTTQAEKNSPEKILALYKSQGYQVVGFVLYKSDEDCLLTWRDSFPEDKRWAILKAAIDKDFVSEEVIDV